MSNFKGSSERHSIMARWAVAVYFLLREGERHFSAISEIIFFEKFIHKHLRAEKQTSFKTFK